MTAEIPSTRQSVEVKGMPKTVKVWARVKPTSKLPKDNLEILSDAGRINIHFRRPTVHTYNPVDNSIHDWSFKVTGILHNASQEQVFTTVAKDIVTSALDGFSGTIMCYGQTGAGKTFTMTGTTENYENRGLIPRSLSHLYQEIDKRAIDQNITVRISYLEIYKETLFDLLAPFTNPKGAYSQPLELTENPEGVYIKGLSSHVAKNVGEAFNLLFEGEHNRIVAAHYLNRVSSRSNCIFTVSLELKAREFSTPLFNVSKLNFVDLAGSEKVDPEKCARKMVTEALYHNRSLCLLEQVVIALTKSKPDQASFRSCKLTHYLKQSLGGTCNTVMIANIWGELAQLEETMFTLRFALRMMSVPQEPVSKQMYEPDTCSFCRASHQRVAQIKELHAEVQRLKEELQLRTNNSLSAQSQFSIVMRNKISQQCQKYLTGVVDEIKINSYKEVPSVLSALKELYNVAESEMEEKLKKKFLLVEKKSGPSKGQMSAQLADHWGEDDNFVGETDGTGFGVGNAPKYLLADPSASVDLLKSQRRKSMKKESAVRGKGLGRRELKAIKADKKASAQRKFSRLKSPVNIEVPEAEVDSISTDGDTAEMAPPATPPPRATAFEEFKLGKGSEINQILLENKKILATKKNDYNEHARKINSIKKEIDNVRQNLETLRTKREAEGPTYTDDGDIVISEEEFMAIKNLKALKTQYHKELPLLKPHKERLLFCENLVQQCRKRLLLEFDKWYIECYVGEEIKDDEKSAISTQDSLATNTAASSIQADAPKTTFTGLTKKEPFAGQARGTTATAMPSAISAASAVCQVRSSSGIQTTSTLPGVSGAVPSKSKITTQITVTEDTLLTIPECDSEKLAPTGPVLPQITNSVPEDEEDFFNRRRLELLNNNEDSAAFYNAQMRVRRRKKYKTASAQPQLSYHIRKKTLLEQSPLLSQRKPGRVSPPISNKQNFMLEGYT